MLSWTSLFYISWHNFASVTNCRLNSGSEVLGSKVIDFKNHDWYYSIALRRILILGKWPPVDCSYIYICKCLLVHISSSQTLIIIKLYNFWQLGEKWYPAVSSEIFYQTFASLFNCPFISFALFSIVILLFLYWFVWALCNLKKLCFSYMLQIFSVLSFLRYFLSHSYVFFYGMKFMIF